MLKLLFIGIDVISAGAVLIPILLLLQQRFQKNSSGKRKMLICLFSLYLCVVFSVTGIPSINSFMLDLTFNPVPFIDIAGSDLGGFIKNFLLNTLLFIPLGMMLPILWSKCGNFRHTLFFGLGLSALIETLQIFTLRLSDIDDLIANTLGAAAGFGITWLWNHRKTWTGKYSGNSTAELFEVFALSFFVMFFIEPFVSEMLLGIIWH